MSENLQIPEIKEQMVFATVYGSKLYGTDGPNSDTDIRGVFLPSREDLLLDRAPRHYNFKDDRDVSYLSLHYFLQLLTQGETNCLDMFFSYTNKAAQICTSPIYEELIANKDKLITKNVSKYLGYCKAQALKYSIKGDRINSLERFMEALSEVKNPSSIDLDAVVALDKRFLPDQAMLEHWEPYIKNNEQIGLRCHVTGTPFGDHFYLVLMDNKERYVMVSGHLFPGPASVTTTIQSVRKCLDSYGKRAENAAADNGADYKALSHAMRVAIQAEELLYTGNITFPLRGPSLDIVKSIKFKTCLAPYEMIIDHIQEHIDTIEKHALPNSKLPEKPDWDWINKFILEQYK